MGQCGPWTLGPRAWVGLAKWGPSGSKVGQVSGSRAHGSWDLKQWWSPRPYLRKFLIKNSYISEQIGSKILPSLYHPSTVAHCHKTATITLLKATCTNTYIYIYIYVYICFTEYKDIYVWACLCRWILQLTSDWTRIEHRLNTDCAAILGLSQIERILNTYWTWIERWLNINSTI